MMSNVPHMDFSLSNQSCSDSSPTMGNMHSYIWTFTPIFLSLKPLCPDTYPMLINPQWLGVLPMVSKILPRGLSLPDPSVVNKFSKTLEILEEKKTFTWLCLLCYVQTCAPDLFAPVSLGGLKIVCCINYHVKNFNRFVVQKNSCVV